MKQVFEIQLEVRDYECDIQGIVNNAVYQNYLEHARHQFLHEIELDFSDWHKQGKDAVVISTWLEYKQSLKPGDKFIIQLRLIKKGLVRIVFDQSIYRLPDRVLCLSANVETVVIQNNRPIKNQTFFEILDRNDITYQTEK
jgi:acyl-CoA thioester hydrolase